jgi:hypothetical protein
MPAPKSNPKQAPTASGTSERKPWKKKTPVEIVLEQAEKLKIEIAQMEEALKAKKKQLEKFDQAKRLFEAS